MTYKASTAYTAVCITPRGAAAQGAKFCPECGAKIDRAAPAPARCPNCNAETQGAKFCPECGTKLV